MKDCYHVKTKEEYEQLMKKLEDDGYIWAAGDKPTKRENLFNSIGKKMVVVLCTEFNEKILRYTTIEWVREKSDEYNIIEFKAKETNANKY
jgi:hypothetical protein